MLTGKFKELLLWTSAGINKGNYKKRLMSAMLSKKAETVSKTLMTPPLPTLPGSIKDLSIMMKNSKTLKEKDAKPISSLSNI